MLYLNKVHTVAWFALIAYLTAETVRTLLTEQTPPVLRWLVLFSCLIPLYFILQKYKDIQFKRIFAVICVLCLVYYIGYIGQGLYSEFILKVSRFNSQGTVWVGSSYAVLPFIIGIPAGMALFHNDLKKLRVLGLLVGIIAVIVSFYYNSRILFILIVCFMILSFFVINRKKALVYSGYLIGTWLLMQLMMFISRLDFVYFEAYMNLIHLDAIDPYNSSDYDRLIEIVAPIKASTLFGYGTYLHHTVLAPYIITESANRGIVFGSDFVRVTGFAAFLTDYGWIGFGLLILNFICVGLKLILNRSKIWLLLGVSLCFGFGWLFVSNILDNLLWWLLIVPFGILERLNHESNGI